MTDPAVPPAPAPPTFPTQLRRKAILLLLTLAAVWAGRAGQWFAGKLKVRDVRAFEALAGGTGAAYATIVNGTSHPETLDSVTSDAAPSVTAHTSRQVNGLIVMDPLEHPSIGPKDSLVFAPGGAHLMLEGVVHDLKAGDSLHLTFWFHHAGSIAAEAKVRPYGS